MREKNHIKISIKEDVSPTNVIEDKGVVTMYLLTGKKPRF